MTLRQPPYRPFSRLITTTVSMTQIGATVKAQGRLESTKALPRHIITTLLGQHHERWGKNPWESHRRSRHHTRCLLRIHLITHNPHQPLRRTLTTCCQPIPSIPPNPRPQLPILLHLMNLSRPLLGQFHRRHPQQRNPRSIIRCILLVHFGSECPPRQPIRIHPRTRISIPLVPSRSKNPL